MAKLVKCKSCGQMIAKNAKTCPHCGGKNEISMGARFLLAILAIICGITLGNFISPKKPGALKTEKPTVSISTVSTESSITGNSVEKNTENTTASATEPSAEKNTQILIDNKYICASFNRVDPTFGIEGFYVYLDIENKTENKTLWIYLDEGSVNGQMCSAVMNAMPVYITPGNTSKNPFIFPAQEHIEEVTKLQFRIHVADKDTMSDYFYSDLITIDLS